MDTHSGRIRNTSQYFVDGPYADDADSEVAVDDRLGRWGRWKDTLVWRWRSESIPPLLLPLPPSPLLG